MTVSRNHQWRMKRAACPATKAIAAMASLLATELTANVMAGVTVPAQRRQEIYDALSGVTQHEQPYVQNLPVASRELIAGARQRMIDALAAWDRTGKSRR